ncbi:MAG TPA: hypothetical protein VF885_11600 [Arthrobacter sp.]
MTITPSHFQPRETSGRYAEKIHGVNETLELPAVPSTVFGDAFDRDHGAEVTAALKALPAVEVHERILASRGSDVLREAHPDYFANGEAERSTAGSHEAFRALLENLDDDRAAHHLELVGFAVHNQVKHLANREFVLGNDYPWEVQADRADYDSEDEFIEEGNADSADVWEAMADTAMALALQENEAAAS